MTLPITPYLRAALDQTDLSGPTIVKTAYGKPSGATKQNQSVLGHETLQQAELYAREADRESLAEQTMEKVVAPHMRRRNQSA